MLIPGNTVNLGRFSSHPPPASSSVVLETDSLTVMVAVETSCLEASRGEVGVKFQNPNPRELSLFDLSTSPLERLTLRSCLYMT